MTMKNAVIHLSLFLAAWLLGGCASLRSSSGTIAQGDDLYEVLDTDALKKEQEAAAAQRRAPLDKYVASILSKNEGETLSKTGNPYQSILVDDFETAYERRLYGFESPTYNMPQSHAMASTNRQFTYATAYDPAQYNIIVSGDDVWVEPKYITSMFGTWGGSPYGYAASPRFAVGFSYRFDPWYSPYYAYYNPFYGWGAPGYWGNPWWAFTESWYYHGMGFYHPWWGYGWGGYGWGCGYYRPQNHRYDSYTGHHVGSGFRGENFYRRGGQYNRRGYYDRGGSYNRRDPYNRREGYNRQEGYNRGNSYNRGNTYNRQSTYTTPTDNTRGTGYNSGGNYNSGGGNNRYNRGR